MTYRHNRRAVKKKDINAGQGYIGVVKNWIGDKGYGFIIMGERNVFVHSTQIIDVAREELEQGETVYFELQQDEKGRLSAKHVRSFDQPCLQPQVQYVQGPTGQIFAVPVNPMQQQQQEQLMIQRYNDMLMVQNQASLQQRHSPQIQAINSLVSEVPSLVPEILPGLNPGSKPATGEATSSLSTTTTNATETSSSQAAASDGATQACLNHQQLQENVPIAAAVAGCQQMPSFQEQLQIQHLQQLQMFQLAAAQQQSQRIVLFPMSMAQNVMLNQPATVLPPGLIQTLPNVPATKKTNRRRQQKTNQGPVCQAGAIHSFYKAFKPY